MNKNLTAFLLVSFVIVFAILGVLINVQQKQIEKLANGLDNINSRIEKNRLTAAMALQQRQKSDENIFSAKKPIGFTTNSTKKT